MVVGPRRHFCGGGHPAGEVGFEGFLVVVAVLAGFALGFPHDVVDCVGGVICEEDVAGLEEALGSRPPDFFAGLGGVGLVCLLYILWGD